MALALRGGGQMVSVKEELELARAAKGAIKVLLAATSKPTALATLKNAYRAAVINLSGEGLLNEARGIVGIATDEKINKAKSAIDTWINNLERSLCGDHYGNAKSIKDDC